MLVSSAIPRLAAGAVRASKAPRKRIPIPDLPPGRTLPRPKPPSDTQLAEQQVRSVFDPIVGQIESQFGARSDAQANAIKQATASLASLMAGYTPVARDAYTGAAAGQSAIDAALAASRQGQGAAAQAELAKELEAIHADPSTTARIGGQFGTDLSGEAQAAAGRGAAGLSALLAEGAHAQDFGAKLPGIAGSMGLQATSQAQGRITSELQQALGDLEAKRPQAVQDALSSIVTNRQRQQQLDFENALAQQKYGLDVKKTKASIAQGNARIRLSQAGLTERQRHDLALEDQAAQRIGISRQRLQQAAAKARSTRKAKGLTANEIASLQAKAQKDAEDLYNGQPAKIHYVNGAPQEVPGTAVYSRTYQDAMKTLMARYPALGPADILKILNGIYPAGKFGRPADDTASKLIAQFTAQGRGPGS